MSAIQKKNFSIKKLLKRRIFSRKYPCTGFKPSRPVIAWAGKPVRYTCRLLKCNNFNILYFTIWLQIDSKRIRKEVNTKEIYIASSIVYQSLTRSLRTDGKVRTMRDTVDMGFLFCCFLRVGYYSLLETYL